LKVLELLISFLKWIMPGKYANDWSAGEIIEKGWEIYLEK
jgi:hypothetical protein